MDAEAQMRKELAVEIESLEHAMARTFSQREFDSLKLLLDFYHGQLRELLLDDIE